MYDASYQKLIQTISGFSRKYQFNKSNGFPCYSTEGVESLKVRKRACGLVDMKATKLEPKNIASVVSGRIFSVRFFPTADEPMIVVGDEFGNFGFCNVAVENDYGYGNYIYHPHSGPVSGLVINPFSLSKMFSSCYGGLIRLMDVEKEMKEMFDLVYSSEYTTCSLSQIPHDMKSLYFSEGHGRVNVWDLKAGKSPSSWNLHDDRNNTINFNPENSNTMTSSSSNGTACIWDLR